MQYLLFRQKTAYDEAESLTKKDQAGQRYRKFELPEHILYILYKSLHDVPFCCNFGVDCVVS